MITKVRNWLKEISGRTTVPGPAAIRRRFANFSEALPDLCDEADLDRYDLPYADYVVLVEGWLASDEGS